MSILGRRVQRSFAILVTQIRVRIAVKQELYDFKMPLSRGSMKRSVVKSAPGIDFFWMSSNEVLHETTQATQ